MAKRKEWWEILRDQFASRGLLDPESERVQEAVQAAPAVQRQARGLLSLDPQAESDTVLEMGLGSLPGTGQLMALRDLERARRAKDPAAAALAATDFFPVGRLAKKFDPVMSRIKAYHGTADDFEAFDPAMGGRATGAESGRQATWFTDDPRVARGYAAYAAENAPVMRKLKEADAFEKIAQKSGKESDWQKHYDAIEEAESLETGGYERKMQNARLLEVDIPNESKLMIIDAGGRTPQELSVKGDIDSWLNSQLKKARKFGKQGVQIKNLDDAAGLANAPSTHYALFDPAGVKIVDKKKFGK
jgi:hypothetical protein